ncbi:MAG: hypothetical protein QOH97_1605 [Actinoplanes sp.]|nr:hypothetical protein [Actinoplanes sp.]
MSNTDVYRRWRLALFATWVCLGVAACAAIVWLLVFAALGLGP